MSLFELHRSPAEFSPLPRGFVLEASRQSRRGLDNLLTLAGVLAGGAFTLLLLVMSVGLGIVILSETAELIGLVAALLGG